VELFESWLRKGLGRAVTFLTSNNGAPYRDAILNACLHNITYDPCEEGRGEYLWMLIQHSGDRNLFRDAVFQHLTQPPDKTDEYDWAQIFHLAKQFASEGDSDMRLAMYSGFDLLGFDTAGVSSATSLINLDVLGGFVFAVKRFDTSSPEDDWWIIGSLISDLEDRVGKQEADQLIASAVAADVSIENVIGAHRRYKEELTKASVRANSEQVDFQALKDMPGESSWAWLFLRWALKTTPEELSAATSHFLSDASPEKVLGCLRVFAHRPFPGDVCRLLELSESDHERVRRAAVVALSKIKDPSVRGRALVLSQSDERFGDGIELLESNYQAGDFRIFEDLFTRSLTPDEIHGVGMSIHNIVDNNVWPELENVLLFLYEAGPCSMCRIEFVDALVELEKLPDFIRDECQFDAEPATRRAVLATVHS